MVSERNIYVLIQRNSQFLFRIGYDIVGYLDILQREFRQQIFKPAKYGLIFHAEHFIDPAFIAVLPLFPAKADTASHHYNFLAFFIQSTNYIVIYNSLNNQFLSLPNL